MFFKIYTLIWGANKNLMAKKCHYVQVKITMIREMGQLWYYILSTCIKCLIPHPLYQLNEDISLKWGNP